MSILLVPVAVDGIMVDIGLTVCGPDMDFSLLPYFDDKLGLDMNADRPWLAEALTASAFENENFNLPKGVHLHWALPDALQRTKPGAAVETDLPPAPNRWYIKRTGGNLSDAEWIVESDYIWPQGTGTDKILSVVSAPVPPNSDACPFRYMGRKFTVAEYSNRMSDTTDANRSDANFRKLSGRPLTAMGWGHHSFDTFYPNAYSVFGMHDDEVSAIASDIIYTVMGWYDETGEDYCRLLSNFPGCIDLDKDTSLDPEERLKRKKKVIADRIQWTDLPDDFANSRTVVFGEFKLTAERNKPTNTTPNDKIQVAVAPTPAEAVSALLASRLNPLGKELFEDQLEALLFAEQLDNTALDTGAKFSQLRHEKGFNAVDSGWMWTLRLASEDSTNPANNGADQMVVIPNSLGAVLEKLNAAQLEYDKLNDHLLNCRTNLYFDWCRYMEAAYPPAGETESYPRAERIMEYIRNRDLAVLKADRTRLGDLSLPAKDKDGKPLKYPVTANDSSLAAEIMNHYNNLFDLAEQENITERQKGKHWEIIQTSAPRYYQANAPSVVVGTVHNENWSPLRSSNRFGNTDIINGSVAPVVLAHDLFDGTKWPLNFTPLVNEIVARRPAPDLAGSSPTGYNFSKDPVWSTFRIEWEVEIFTPKASSNLTADDANLSPDFIDASYHIDENDLDFIQNQDAVLNQSAFLYKGGGIVSSGTQKYYSQVMENWLVRNPKEKQPAIADFIDKLSNAHRDLKSLDVLSFSLEGLNSAMLQQFNHIRLNPRDPLGFADYKEFAADVASELYSRVGNSPSPLNPFLPIRAGAFTLRKIRLVDTFGRTWDVTPQHIITCTPYTLPDRDDRIKLSPRIVQPARLNFRWLSGNPADDPAKESNDSLLTNPVVGWLVPNNMEQSLLVYNGEGENIGSINQKGEWEPSITGKVLTLDDVKTLNYHLHNVVTWIIDASLNNKISTPFMELFIANLQQAQDNVHPQQRYNMNALSLLAGQPIAIARVAINLQLKGMPVFNQSWIDFRSYLQGSGRNTAGFTKVRFPFTLGEYSQLDDGLIGYWSESRAGNLSGNFSICDSILSQVDYDYAAKIAALADRAIYDNDKSRFVSERKSITDNCPSLAAAALDTEDSLNQYIGIIEKLKKDTTLASFLKDRPSHQVRRIDIIRRFDSGKAYWEILLAIGALWREQPVPNIRHYAEIDASLYQTIDNPPGAFTLLFDPLGKVHLSTGLFPVKEIDLPRAIYERALKRMELHFLTAPILFSNNRLNLSLPSEEGKIWAWVDKSRKGGLVSNRIIYQRPFVRKEIWLQTQSALPLSMDSIWDKLMAAGWITAIAEDSGSAFINAQATKDDSNLSADLKPHFNNLKILLSQATEQIDPYSDRAKFAGRTTIREGWLRLTQE